MTTLEVLEREKGLTPRTMRDWSEASVRCKLHPETISDIDVAMATYCGGEARAAELIDARPIP